MRFFNIIICAILSFADHFIISERSYYSFEVSGLLDKLKLSTKYVPPYILEERVRKEAQMIAEKSVVLWESEIAICLLAKGVDIPIISKTTGLSIEEIEALERGE